MMSAVLQTATRATISAMKMAAPAKPKAAPRKPKPAPRAAPAPLPRKIAPPRNAAFRAGTHSCDLGKRRFKIYVPAMAAGTPLPLLVMLHGCGQTADDFAKGTRMNALAEEFQMLVLYPEQAREAHSNRCWNWFRRGDQGRGDGEPGLLADLTRAIIEKHPVDPARVYVAGLSAGASAALVLGNAYPDLFAAVGAHSGLPVGAARDSTSAMMAMGQGSPGNRPSAAIPTIIFHGSDDKVVNPRNGRFIAIRALEPFRGLRNTQTRGQVPGGRHYIKTAYRKGQGRPVVEEWVIDGSGHAWSGGSRAGRFVDPAGPDASRAMVRFFLRHKLSLRARSPRHLDP
ncbi:extracellular catalytic domain type 1 short-chain-length polyhydroxyalkanoate depolymerase [Paracoccus sp. T5]